MADARLLQHAANYRVGTNFSWVEEVSDWDMALCAVPILAVNYVWWNIH